MKTVADWNAQAQLKEEAQEIKSAIVEKRSANVHITSLNAQRIVSDELGRLTVSFGFTLILLLGKLVRPNLVNTWLVVGGFLASFAVFFYFGTFIIRLKIRQEEGSESQKLILFQVLLVNTVPYVFGCSLILFCGIHILVSDFSWFYLFQAAAYALVGYGIMKKAKLFIEIGFRIAENKDSQHP